MDLIDDFIYSDRSVEVGKHLTKMPYLIDQALTRFYAMKREEAQEFLTQSLKYLKDNGWDPKNISVPKLPGFGNKIPKPEDLFEPGDTIRIRRKVGFMMELYSLSKNGEEKKSIKIHPEIRNFNCEVSEFKNAKGELIRRGDLQFVFSIKIEQKKYMILLVVERKLKKLGYNARFGINLGLGSSVLSGLLGAPIRTLLSSVLDKYMDPVLAMLELIADKVSAENEPKPKAETEAETEEKPKAEAEKK